jgi:hypothetical protein
MTEPSEGKWESPEEILEREIQELEKPYTRSWYTWAASLAAAAVLGGILTLLLVMPGGLPTNARPRQVDLFEPKQASLDEVPRAFRWSAVRGASAYIVSVTRADNGEVVMLRSTTDPWVATLDTEVSRFDAGRYVWAVEAHGGDGRTVGRGEGAFSLRIGG